LKSDYRSPSTFDVTGRELGEYVKSHASAMRCPVCGNAEYPVLSADALDETAHLVSMPILLPNPGFAHASCMAHCSQCGHIWLFWANKVIDWVLEQRRKAGEDE